MLSTAMLWTKISRIFATFADKFISNIAECEAKRNDRSEGRKGREISRHEVAETRKNGEIENLGFGMNVKRDGRSWQK